MEDKFVEGKDTYLYNKNDLLLFFFMEKGLLYNSAIKVMCTGRK